MKKEEREIALRPTNFQVPGSKKMIDLRTLDESDPEVYNTIYYKEYPIVTGNMDKTVIITYSPKYKVYQQKIRQRQIERAIKININKRRWEIEENFRIMKSEFEARPVFVRREDRIKAHFLTCYISLLVYRLLEKKLYENFTCTQILETLRTMNMKLLTKDSGYIPSYKRTHVTDALHEAFGFRTDYEFISKASMRTIIKDSKEHKIAQNKK